jgi:membrane protein YqaA with SNARE-associated domain
MAEKDVFDAGAVGLPASPMAGEPRRGGSLALQSRARHAQAAVPEAEPELPGLRWWFVGFVAWMVLLAVAFRAAFAAYETGADDALRIWALAALCFYLSLCNLFLPLPTAWVILLAASHELMLFPAPWERITVVTLLGAAATTIANLNEYHVLSFLLGARLSRRLKRSRLYEWGQRWFDVSPFQTLTLIAFIPVPIDAVRWLAILRRYSRWRFAGAYFLGRAGRYALLAGLSVVATLTPRQIAWIQVAIILVLASRLLLTGVRRLLRRREPQAC